MKKLYLEKGFLSHRKNIIRLQKTIILCEKKKQKQTGSRKVAQTSHQRGIQNAVKNLRWNALRR